MKTQAGSGSQQGSAGQLRALTEKQACRSVRLLHETLTAREAYKRQKYVSHGSGGQEARGQGPS